MAKRNFRYQHIRTSTLGAVPTQDKLKDGELGVNIAKDGEKIFLKNVSGDVVSFITESQIDTKIQSQSGTTDGKIQALSGAVDSVSGVVSTNTTNIETLDGSKFGAVFYDKNAKKINFYDKSTTGTVLGTISTDDFVKDGMIDSVEIVEQSGDTYLRITWNTDASKEITELNIGDIFNADNYYTKTETDTSIETATSGKVDTSTFNTFSANTNSALETKVDNSTYNTYTAATATALSGKQDTLVSGTNIKTVVTKSLIGSGNVEISITELSDIDVDNDTVILDAGSF
jgi:hypothetical protein